MRQGAGSLSVSEINLKLTRPRAALALALLAGTFALGACSDRDAKLSEAISAAEQAARRAEQAADRAEKAAGTSKTTAAPVVVEDEPEPEATETEPAVDEAEGTSTHPEARNQ